MKSLTVRLPEPLVAELEAESRQRKISKSDIVRERLEMRAVPMARRAAPLADVEDLIGAVTGLRPDVSGRRKQYLKATGYGRARSR
jgi:hypothetical protein